MTFSNHFDPIGPRTNNDVKGYNLKLKKHIAVAKPNILKSITTLKRETVDAEVKYHKGEIGEPRPPRRKLHIITDEIWHNYKRLLLDNAISLENYIKYVAELYLLENLDKKEDKEDKETDDEEDMSDDESE